LQLAPMQRGKKELQGYRAGAARDYRG